MVIVVLVAVACSGHQQDIQFDCFGKLSDSIGYLHKLRTQDSRLVDQL